MATEDWILQFPDYQVSPFPSASSDHNVILLLTVKPGCRKKQYRFRFENASLEEDDCKSVIEGVWRENASLGVQSKIERCGKVLGDWGRDKFRELDVKIESKQKEMAEFSVGVDAISVARHRRAVQEYVKLIKQKDDYWRQRAKIHWIKEGDQNTKFFHSMATTRRKKNKIEKIKDCDGTWYHNGSGLEQLIVNYYSDLFSGHGNDDVGVCDLITKGISDEQNVQLTSPFLEAEIKEALDSMHSNKAPGVDGMNPAFFQRFWDIMGADVVKECLQILNSAVMPPELNCINIVLIPKKNSPKSLIDLRPIALCNVLYKIIAKTLANRLKKVLYSVIFESQSAFIPGRLIIDNILITSEVLHYLKRKQHGKEGMVALKVDMSKAYDRVEWKYLENVMRFMGFNENWIRVVMMCVTTVRYQVVLDDELLGPIIPQRGLRQGDLLSPYLFILCAEGLSTLLWHGERRGDIHGCRVSASAPPLTRFLLMIVFYFGRLPSAKPLQSKKFY